MGVLFTLRRPLMQVATVATRVTPYSKKHKDPHAATNDRPQVELVQTPATHSGAPRTGALPRGPASTATNAGRAAALVRGIEASIVGDSTIVSDLYTEDVRVSTPALILESAVELAVEIEDRESAFTDIDIEITALDVGGDRACAEWIVRFTHSGPLELNDDAIEPTGSRVTMHGVTVADFEGGRISAFRQYWDEASLLEQLGLLPVEERGGSEAPDQ
jgi:ketosteroid isomerase-like protein